MTPSRTPGLSRLSNPTSERVRKVARLAGRSARQRAGRFLAEGPQAVTEAVPAGVVSELYVADDAMQRYPALLEEATRRGAQLFGCDPAVMAALSDTVTPQGLVAVCRPVDVPLEDLVRTAKAHPPALVAVLSQVRDPGNAGTVIRATDAAGGVGVVLSEASVDPYNPKCVRSTAGSLFHLAATAGPSLTDTVQRLREAGLAVLAADGAGDTDLDDLQDAAEQGEGPLAGPVAWVFGNEAHGLAEAEAALADEVVRVPLHGRAESLNLGTAAAVCLYAAARAHRRAMPPRESLR